MSELRSSEEYVSFRSSVPLKKIIVDDDTSKFWGLYDAGPRNIRCPLICFPPASGHADVFYKQVLGLSANGYRVISVEYPVYWEMNEFLDGFLKLLDDLHLDRVHLFGASLGGYLAQKFAEYTQPSHRVQSLILCNSFVDTTVFQQTNSASSFWLMPALLLKKMVMGSFEKGPADSDVIKSIDFMVDSLDSLEQSELASRLTLNCTNSYVEPQKLAEIPITIIDVNDGNAISNSVREETYKCYPQAKLALMKTGGNFPYLSRAEEINVHLKIHLMQFWGTRFSALDPSRELHADSNGTDDEERENDFTKQTSR